MPFDFHDLKTVSLANDEVTLRIPRRWEVVPHESDEGRWQVNCQRNHEHRAALCSRSDT